MTAVVDCDGIAGFDSEIIGTVNIIFSGQTSPIRCRLVIGDQDIVVAAAARLLYLLRIGHRARGV